MADEEYPRRPQKLQQRLIEKERLDARGFRRAWAAGALAGGLPYTLMYVPSLLEIARQPTELIEYGWIVLAMIMPVLLAGFVTLIALTVIGMSVTRFLKSRNRENLKNYLLAGVLGGALCALLLAAGAGGVSAAISPVAAMLLGIPGLLAGFATSLVWGRHRVRMGALSESSGHTPSPNPIHDLIY